MGLYVEDFEIGRTITTRGRTVAEGDITLFAGLSGDFNPLHVDEEFCAGTPYGSRIAHGPMVLSMAIGLMSQQNMIDGTALALLGLEWKFSGPVRIGDTIHVRVTPVEKRISASKPDRGVVVVTLEVVNQRDEAVQIGSMTLLMRARPREEPISV